MSSRFKLIKTALIIAAWVLTALSPIGVTPVYAASLVVNTANEGSIFGDGCSLREAITNANNDNQSGSIECAAGSGADTILFAGNYTITLASALPDLTGNLTIDGSGRRLTVSGNNAVRVFRISSSGVVTLSNLSLINGRGALDITCALSTCGGGILNDLGTVTVSHSTFSGNSATYGGSILNFGGTLTVSHSTFSGNSATNYGGGISNSSGGMLTVSNSTFSGNSATFGGGILNSSDTVTVSHSTFSGNSATSGGGIYNGINGTLHLRNSLMANSPSGGDCYNSGTLATNLNNLIRDGSCSPALSGDPLLGPLGDYGGSTQTFALLPGSPAIDAAGDCSPYLNPDEDQRGVARPQGSACDIGAFETRKQPGPNFVVNVSDDSDDGSCDWFEVGAADCTLREAINAANSLAGADTITFAGDYTITLASTLPNLAGNLTIDGSGRNITVSGNSAVGVFVIQPTAVVTMQQLSIINGLEVNFGGIYNFGTLVVENSIISGNQASTGGGIHNAGTLTISHSTFSSNTAFNGGGGIRNAGTLTVSNSTFSGNSAPNNNGGGIDNPQGTLTVANSTFSGNSAGGYGGGIANSGTLTITNSTFSGNSVNGGSGGGIASDGTLHLQNSLIANSSNGGDCQSFGAIIATNANNLIEDDSCSPALSGDPNLGPLANNGGSTQTFALLSGSPAIDAAGDCSPYLHPNEDQRGVVRPQGSACDIGAFEVKEQSGPNFVVNVSDDSDDGSCDVFGLSDCTLREAIDAANSLTGADTITFAGDYTITLGSALPPVISTLTIDGSGRSVTVSGNNAVRVFSIQPGASVTLNQLSIIDGRNDQGGGIYNQGTLAISYSTFSGNSVIHRFTDGGGIYNGGMLTVSHSTFNGNRGGDGGGISNSGTLTVSHSTFSDNSGGGGGGIYNNGTATITNSTFSDNSAVFGGGIANDGTLTVTHSTINGNSASEGGGIYNLNTLHQRNSLMANSPSGGDCYNTGTLATNLNNLIEDGTCSPTLSGDPNLGPLGNNGGSTQTFALLPGSPAINTGTNTNCPADDQRGVTRPQNGLCDIGAYEYDYAGIYYVKPTAGGAMNCRSWADACELRNALSTVSSGDEIWVAAGAHTPSATGDRHASFILKNGVGVYGGFAGTETLRTQRNFATNVTILSGDLNGDDVGYTNNSENAYHVVIGSGTDATAILDGFTISGGYANSLAAPNDSGGGMYNDAGSPTVTNATFSGNFAGWGGGMFNIDSSPTLTNVTFSGNAASANGGGMTNYASNLTVMNATFSNNTAGWGGGIYNSSNYSPGSSLMLSNATFSGNSALEGGGMFNVNGSPTLTNVTFSGNSATTNGGGMYNYDYGILTLKNVILANSASGGDCVNDATSSVAGTSSNNLIEDAANACGLTDGINGNIVGQDPRLDALADNGGSTSTFALLPGSPAIDAGTSCATDDQRGVARPQGAHCDIGAFESRGSTLTKVGGDNQSTLIQTDFPNSLVISVTSAAGEPVNGGQVILTAPVSGASLMTTPITLTITNSAVSTTVTANNTAGSYSVVASSSGAANVAFNLANDLADTTTSLTSTPNPSVYGQAITFTATVTTSAVGLGTPIGSITFTIDSLSVNVPLDANGQAVYITATLLAGHHPITVTYNGDANHNGSTSNTIDQVVNQADSTTTIVSALNPSIVGEAVTFTATVASTVATPTGSVQFYADGAVLGSPVTLSNGQASLSTSALAVGTHAITATYSGDANHSGSTSNTMNQVVNPADTAATLTSALNPSIVGQAVTFTITVASTVDTPSGSVQFYADGAVLGSPLALSNGQASLSTSALAVGTHAITATYSGDANHSGGTSNQVDQVVNNAKIYLPLISHNFVNAPDLIVQSLTANANTVQVVIKNQGTAPVVDEFWVDVYVNPISAPTAVNQTWQMLGHQGLVWGVTANALPALTPGGVLTLTVNDAHFFADLSAVAWPLAAGTQLYAQVDTADAATTYGAVLETHEVRGEPYNNIFGPVSSSALTLTIPPRHALLSSATLPLRPH